MEESGSFKKRRFLIYSVTLILLASGLLIGYYLIAMSFIPFDDADLGEMEEEMVLPERPGTQSLILSGPIIRPLVFTIDLRKPGILSLDWEELKSLDPTADVRVTATIGSDGSLVFDSVDDVYCPGHTRAGQMIARVLRTWSYTPYMVGPIVFSFHVGAVGKKVTIDISKLQRKEGLDPDTPIKTGLLYLIEKGLKRNQVKIKTW